MFEVNWFEYYILNKILKNRKYYYITPKKLKKGTMDMFVIDEVAYIK